MNIEQLRAEVWENERKSHRDGIGKIISVLIELEKDKFYGALTFKYENGGIVYAKKEETIKL